MREAAERIQKYLDGRAKARGLDSDEIIGIHAGGEREAFITASDLHLILAALDAEPVASSAQPLQPLFDVLIENGHISDREHLSQDDLLKLVLSKFEQCAQPAQAQLIAYIVEAKKPGRWRQFATLPGYSLEPGETLISETPLGPIAAQAQVVPEFDFAKVDADSLAAQHGAPRDSNGNYLFKSVNDMRRFAAEACKAAFLSAAPAQAQQGKVTQPQQVEKATCTLCASAESDGFYTGCMIQDGQITSDWACDGKGNLTRPAAPRRSKGR